MTKKWIGWCNKDDHDKIWGIIVLNENLLSLQSVFLTFWGRRTGKLQTKVFKDATWISESLIYHKQKKGYQPVTESLDEVREGLEREISKLQVMAMLKVSD